MGIDKANPMTDHQLTFMPASPGKPTEFGWIRLINGETDAGYIYLTSPPVEPHLSSKGTYIVTSIPVTELSAMLDILRNERGPQIRFFDPQTPGVEPSVFIEATTSVVGRTNPEFHAPEEIAKEIVGLRV